MKLSGRPKRVKTTPGGPGIDFEGRTVTRRPVEGSITLGPDRIGSGAVAEAAGEGPHMRLNSQSPPPKVHTVRPPTILSILALTFFGWGCDNPPPPGPGTLTVTLVSPTQAEGAAQIRLVGPGMGAAAPLEGELHVRRRGDTLSVLVLRPDSGSLRFLLQVEDTTRRPRGSVVQVAGPDNAVRAALGGYAVDIRR